MLSSAASRRTPQFLPILNSADFHRLLADRADAAGISVSTEVAQRLEAYFQLLRLWNEKMNLTALPLADPPPSALDRLLIEPLVAASYVSPAARAVLDVGSGGGSPAIPFALAARLRLTMVEVKSRKATFLREALRATALDGVVITARIEDLTTNGHQLEPHDIVTIRAVRATQPVLESAASLLAPDGHLFLFTSPETALEFPGPLRLAQTVLLTATATLAVLTR